MMSTALSETRYGRVAAECIAVCCEATSVFTKTCSPVLVLSTHLAHLHGPPGIFSKVSTAPSVTEVRLLREGLAPTPLLCGEKISFISLL